MAFYDGVFSSELIAAIDAASAQMGPFELTRQLLYFYMSQRGIFDDEMWECVHELSESSFGDADYSDRLDQLYEKYAPEFYSEEGALDPRKEPERWNEADVAVTVADGLSYGLRDPVRYLPFHFCYNAKKTISGDLIRSRKLSKTWLMRPGSSMVSHQSWLSKLMLRPRNLALWGLRKNFFSITCWIMGYAVVRYGIV